MIDYIDWFELDQVIDSLLEGRLTSEALSQRIARCLKKGDRDRYLTLKLAQSYYYFSRKVKK